MTNFFSFFILHGTTISIVLRAVSTVQLLFFVIPLQIKEMRIANGLRLLRLQLLALGILLFIVNILTFIVLINIVNTHAHQTYLNSILQVANSLAFIGIAFLGNRIYTGQYTDSQLEKHQKIEDLEEAEKK